MTKTVDQIVAGIPRHEARDADYETSRFASGTRAQKSFETEAEAKALAEQLKREGWQDVVVWHAASGWIARGMKDHAGATLDKIVAKIPRRGYSLRSGLDAVLARGLRLDAALAGIPDRRRGARDTDASDIIQAYIEKRITRAQASGKLFDMGVPWATIEKYLAEADKRNISRSRSWGDCLMNLR